MQVPEELSLIGGSILLASTLVFTLKSQASDILPKVNNGISSLMKTDQERQQDQQKQQEQAFNDKFQQAQQNKWQTGQWGTAKFYVDNNENMHVGSGQLNGSFSKVVNDQQIKTISLDESVQAPQDNNFLFADINYNTIPLMQINSLYNLDTSQATNMSSMFELDSNIQNMDISHFDTSNVNNMSFMFFGDNNLSNLDVSHFNTHNVTNMKAMFDNNSNLSNLNLNNFNTSNTTDMERIFYGDSNLKDLNINDWDTSQATNMNSMFYGDNDLTNLDLSHFDTLKVTDMENMFDQANVQQLTLGTHTKLQNITSLSGTYQNNNQKLNGSQLEDDNAHPGTWIEQ